MCKLSWEIYGSISKNHFRPVALLGKCIYSDDPGNQNSSAIVQGRPGLSRAPTENLGVRRQVHKGQPFRRHGALIDFKVLPMLVQDCAELFRLMRERLYPRAEFVAGNASTISV